LSKSPTVDTQIVTLKGGGADAFLIVATPKFAAQAIRRSYDLGWTADRYVTAVSESIATVLKPAGLEKAKGLINNDVTDARRKAGRRRTSAALFRDNSNASSVEPSLRPADCVTLQMLSCCRF
jgi:hypothetical protein